MKITAIASLALALMSLTLPGCASNADSHEQTRDESHPAKQGESEHAHKIIVTSPLKKNLISARYWLNWKKESPYLVCPKILILICLPTSGLN